MARAKTAEGADAMSNIINLADVRRDRARQQREAHRETLVLFAALAKLYRADTGREMLDAEAALTREFLMWVDTQPRPDPADVLTPAEIAAAAECAG